MKIKAMINNHTEILGPVSSTITPYMLKTIPVEAWTNWYYIPGKVSWAEAEEKAKERMKSPSMPNIRESIR